MELRIDSADDGTLLELDENHSLETPEKSGMGLAGVKASRRAKRLRPNTTIVSDPLVNGSQTCFYPSRTSHQYDRRASYVLPRSLAASSCVKAAPHWTPTAPEKQYVVEN
jgi:hypothetical protein